MFNLFKAKLKEPLTFTTTHVIRDWDAWKQIIILTQHTGNLTQEVIAQALSNWVMNHNTGMPERKSHCGIFYHDKFIFQRKEDCSDDDIEKGKTISKIIDIQPLTLITEAQLTQYIKEQETKLEQLKKDVEHYENDKEQIRLKYNKDFLEINKQEHAVLLASIANLKIEKDKQKEELKKKEEAFWQQRNIVKPWIDMILQAKDKDMMTVIIAMLPNDILQHMTNNVMEYSSILNPTKQIKNNDEKKLENRWKSITLILNQMKTLIQVEPTSALKPLCLMLTMDMM